MDAQIVLPHIVFHVESGRAAGKRAAERRLLPTLKFPMPVQVALERVFAPARAEIRLSLRGTSKHRVSWGSMASSNTSQPLKLAYIYR